VLQLGIGEAVPDGLRLRLGGGHHAVRRGPAEAPSRDRSQKHRHSRRAGHRSDDGTTRRGR